VLLVSKRRRPACKLDFDRTYIVAFVAAVFQDVESDCHECGGAGVLRMETLPAVIPANPRKTGTFIAIIVPKHMVLSLRAGMAPASPASSCTWTEVRIAAQLCSCGMLPVQLHVLIIVCVVLQRFKRSESR
jgi:hypothetical protein